jgi:hypothetical protein
MATPDSSLSSLVQIRTKVRRLTRSPSTSQLTEQQIDDYINTFVLYDFPEFTLDKKLTFYLMPNIDQYGNNTVNADDPLYNFVNISLSVQTPVYVGGEVVYLSQSREQFYGQYPKYNYEESIGTGDDSTVAFSGTLSNVPLLARTVMFSSIDSSGNGIVISDVPRMDGVTGLQTQVGDLVVPDDTASVGTINYLTGVYSFTFGTAPGDGEDVVAQAYKYATGKPTAVLYEDNTFIFRPVPDKSYRVEIDAFKRPTELLADADEPELAQWWQYIAYGASKKVFEDRMDVESVQAIMPEFMRQRSLVLRRLVVQQSTERTGTIYTDMGAGFYVDKNGI